MKRIFLLGSTGSIGQSALDVIRTFPDKFKVAGITAHSNISLLEKQIEEFKPEVVVVNDPAAAAQIENHIPRDFQLFTGISGLKKAAQSADYDILLTAIVGFAGLAPTIEGIKRGKRIALANKETLVVAGEFIMNLCKEYGSDLLPVDSEHSALFQCLTGEKIDNVEKLILTASGGPFRTLNDEQLKSVTVEDALNHPNWDMGNKITIDSATMMNKGLEVIEAKWLFGFDNSQIEVVVHPQSIIHSMVEFIDGSIKAQLSTPDMKLPIQYAFSFPDRLPSSFVATNFPDLKELTFFEPDLNKFRCLDLAFQSMASGGTSPCILNAANEVAVEKFLKREIPFNRIPEIIDSSLNKIENIKNPDIDTIFECDKNTREFASTLN